MCTNVMPTTYMCRIRAIQSAMLSLKNAQTEVSLGRSALGIHVSDGTAGNFFRFARRTVLDDHDDEVSTAPSIMH